MNKVLKEIYYRFEGKLVGNKFLKISVCRALSKMPEDIVEFVTKNCWFVGSIDDAWAFTFTGNDLKNQHLIFLSDHLLQQDENQIEFSIAHEIGHVILGHRNSVSEKQTKQEINLQEKQADQFATNLGF